ncbi:hypothetical protein P7K49_037778 [Saguinus oedipus]|uniref:Uncharacterized protein n=1 Tax=Saguinus oedipus TaxID=9490 RepID=A0ABQ9TJL8_SAGOE|nr:hypothetical protein P7K49_037778 [Saguinus oedipus]
MDKWKYQNHSERFVFIAEWYDPNASLLRRYELLFYPGDGSVEMAQSQAELRLGMFNHMRTDRTWKMLVVRRISEIDPMELIS